MLYMEKNPYLWDTTAQDITSPVLSLSLTTHNESVDVQNLADPVVVTLPNPSEYKTNETNKCTGGKFKIPYSAVLLECLKTMWNKWKIKSFRFFKIKHNRVCFTMLKNL